MIILVQVGNLGSSVIDHLFSPLARAKNVERIIIFCHRPGPVIPKVQYYCPPRLLTRFALFPLIWEFVGLLYTSLLNRKAYIAGYLLYPHAFLAFITAKLTRKPVILSLIAGIPELYTKGTVEGIDFHNNAPPWTGRLALYMLRHSASVITTGSVTKAFLVKHKIEPEKIYPMINPANKSRFYVQKIPKTYDVISIGALSVIKHNEVLLYAINEIKKNVPNIKACLVGNGSRKPELVKLAEGLGIKENVDFVGFQKDVPHFLNSARIFVHTSEREGFPNVVLEAMMCGIPCVVSNCGDIIDAARDGYNSLVISKYNDYKGYAEAITKLLNDEELLNELSRNGLKTTQSISEVEIAHRWEMLLEKMNQHG
jgi:glycosyltransferase involved in cell wall biosynthesis